MKKIEKQIRDMIQTLNSKQRKDLRDHLNGNFVYVSLSKEPLDHWFPALTKKVIKTLFQGLKKDANIFPNGKINPMYGEKKNGIVLFDSLIIDYIYLDIELRPMIPNAESIPMSVSELLATFLNEPKSFNQRMMCSYIFDEMEKEGILLPNKATVKPKKRMLNPMYEDILGTMDGPQLKFYPNKEVMFILTTKIERYKINKASK